MKLLPSRNGRQSGTGLGLLLDSLSGSDTWAIQHYNDIIMILSHCRSIVLKRNNVCRKSSQSSSVAATRSLMLEQALAWGLIYNKYLIPSLINTQVAIPREADFNTQRSSSLLRYTHTHHCVFQSLHWLLATYIQEDEALVAAQAATEQVRLVVSLARSLLSLSSWTIQELQKQREDEINGLKEELSDLTSTIENLDLKIKKFSASIQQLHEDRLQQASRNKIEEDSYRVKKKTFDLLPNADENIAKLEVMVSSPSSLNTSILLFLLQELVGTSRERLKKLATKWEEVREPLVQQYRQLKMKNEASEVANARFSQPLLLAGFLFNRVLLSCCLMRLDC